MQLRASLLVAMAVTLTQACGSGEAEDSSQGAAAGSPGAAGTDGLAAAAGAAGVPLPGPYDYADQVPPAQSPPGGLTVEQSPLFVTLAFDDNSVSGLPDTGSEGGMTWATALAAARTNVDGSPVRFSFYLTSTYIADTTLAIPPILKASWRNAYEAGHEIGSHTHAHTHGGAFTADEWDAEIGTNLNWLTRPFDAADPASGVGVPAAAIRGFRTPFMDYDDALFSVLQERGFWYECTIEEGWEGGQDGTNFYWPYTLDQGSPGNDLLVQWGLRQPVAPHPGLWEMPVYVLMVPPDERCAEYGTTPGLRDRMHAAQDYFEVGDGKVTGSDWNLWVLFQLGRADVLAILEYSLDLRRQGNRAPFPMLVHSQIYSNRCADNIINATIEERQATIAEFLDYALGLPEVRVTSVGAMLDWMRRPTALP